MLSKNKRKITDVVNVYLDFNTKVTNLESVAGYQFMLYYDISP